MDLCIIKFELGDRSARIPKKLIEMLKFCLHFVSAAIKIKNQDIWCLIDEIVKASRSHVRERTSE